MFSFIEEPIKTLGSGRKFRVGRVSGNNNIIFLGLMIKNFNSSILTYINYNEPLQHLILLQKVSK